MLDHALLFHFSDFCIFFSKMSTTLYILTRKVDGDKAFSIGKLAYITEPKLPDDKEELIKRLNELMESEEVITIK